MTGVDESNNGHDWFQSQAAAWLIFCRNCAWPKEEVPDGPCDRALLVEVTP